jgi:Na+/proline symporter
LIIIFAGLFFAAFLLVRMLPEGMGLTHAIALGKDFGKMNMITSGFTEKGFNWNDRFNVISGTIGGFFLALSYFGTDQSQVGRYLTGSSIKQSRTGLLMNGLVKIPMQFFILLIGVLVFVFYLFHTTPLYFNDIAIEKLKQTSYKNQVELLEKQHNSIDAEKKMVLDAWNQHHGLDVTAQLQAINKREVGLRTTLSTMIKESKILVEGSDTNYIFIRFVMDHMPHGLIGLLIAVIFLAAWGSNAASLNALSSSSLIDFHRRYVNKELTPEREFRLSRVYTLIWGVFCIVFAEFATNLGSLIEAVNVLGSWFYGVMLGIFLVAFYFKKVGGNAVFGAAILGEAVVIGMYLFTQIGWLWLNVIGACAVVIVALILQPLFKSPILFGGRRIKV